MPYPTIAEVNQAGEYELFVWHDSLPEPQTDVEHTVSRRIKKLCWQNSEKHIRDANPEAADMLNKLAEDVSKVLGTDAREL